MKSLIKTQSKIKTVILLMVAFFALSMQSCNKDGATVDPTSSAAFRQFGDAMHKLWADHMQYTYLTVDAFFNNNTALNAQLTRLLKNQEDIGAAIVPYYGQAAGDQLTVLLKGHINGAVPVLTAAKNGDQTALDAAVAAWRVNGKEIADFLSAANPENWEQSHMRIHMDDHLTKTIAYSVSLLQTDYAQASINYDAAFSDMMHFADQLAVGIAKQFPNKF
ncbi:MAG: hypothetical protein KF781_01195 [Chitinophagaceae bacterium]|nr:hypothetical protein [Chitinophagaceae bacterium]MCW5905351.1 hypothetical protein [Chitinophagaceae bacterium]